jgi:hypothetical protein
MELQSSIMALQNISAIADPAAGIAIMLGPCAQHAWQNAGSPDPYCPGKIVDANTQITLQKTKQPSFFVACVYAPSTVKWNQTTLASFPNSMKLSKTTSSNSHMIQLPSLVATSMPLLASMIQMHLKMSLDHTDSIIQQCW